VELGYTRVNLKARTFHATKTFVLSESP
jgi:hypothetical protein